MRMRKGEISVAKRGFCVEDFVREYVSAGEGGLAWGEQQRLDRISLLALREVEHRVQGRGLRGDFALVEVAVEIDLGSMTDSEAAQVWADAVEGEVVRRASSRSVVQGGGAGRAGGWSDGARSVPAGIGGGALRAMPEYLPLVRGNNYTFNMVENPGPLADVSSLEAMRKSPAGNFAGGKYNAITLQEDKILYRAGEGGGGKKALGQWFTEAPATSDIQARVDSAVKLGWNDPATGKITAWSEIDSAYKVRIPKGTTVYVGPAGSQGGALVGGKEQIFVQRPWDLPGVKALEETRLPNVSAASKAMRMSRLATGARIVGHSLVALDAGMSVYQVISAPAGQKARVVAHEGGRFAGAWGGGMVGAEGGAEAGAAIGAFFGGVGAVPGAFIGGLLGGLGGALLGGWMGSTTGDTLYAEATEAQADDD